MLSEEMIKLGKVKSAIRELFEYGNSRAKEIGKDNVFDFSIGNPSVPAPESVNNTIKKLIDELDSVSLHGYTSAAGDSNVRNSIALYLNNRYRTSFKADDLYLTTGAAAALSITFKALTCNDDEFIVFAPFFPEYRIFIENAGAKVVTVSCRTYDFQIDFEALKKAVNKNTKGIVLNSPCNPSGVVFSADTVKKLSDILRDAEGKYGHPVFIISDEPYREIVYGDIEVPFVPDFYDDTVICYSFSKSLSLPGERIGYILVNSKCAEHDDLCAAVAGAGRSLGYVCATSLFQKILPECLGLTSDISVYKKNRDILYENLTKYGYSMPHPDGAFYLFVKSLEPDAVRFCENAKKYELLLVPSDSFGIPGYVRISYCVSTEMIERSLPAFKALADAYKKGEF